MLIIFLDVLVEMGIERMRIPNTDFIDAL